MARQKKKDRLIRLAFRTSIDDGAKSLLVRLIQDSDRGFINSFSVIEPVLTKEIFNNDAISFVTSLASLINSHIVSYNLTDDILFVLPSNDNYFNKIHTELLNRKRKYYKTKDIINQGILGVFSKGKYGRILNDVLASAAHDEEGPDMIYSSKENGFKIPMSLSRYLTSEPLKEDELNSLLKYGFGRDLLVLEEARTNLSKEEKRAYCACIAFSDVNGVIEDYNIHSLVQSIKKEFGGDSYSVPTMYLAIAKLLELKLVEEFFDYSKGCNSLKVVNYKESFEQKERYVIIPSVVLSKAFKKLQSSAIKLFFHFVFLLNNGEDNSKYIGQGKAIYFKYSKSRLDSSESKRNYDLQQAWLKKRYPGETASLLFGDIDDDDYAALAEFFHFYIDKNRDTVLQVRIKREYFISKKAEKLKQLFSLKGRDKVRTSTIEGALKDYKIDYDTEQLLSFIRIFKGASGKVIKMILGQLAERINTGRQNGWRAVENIVAYVQTLYKSYRAREPDKLIDLPALT